VSSESAASLGCEKSEESELCATRSVLSSHSSLSSQSECIRVWAFEVPAYERRGWQLRGVRRGVPSEALLGPDYADCLMVREVDDG
jgi:hypothetical protein